MAGSTTFLSSKAIREVHDALTDQGFFGVPRYTTALLPPIPGTGALAFDTTSAELKVFNGSVWDGVASAGSITPGTTTVTGGTNAVLYADGSSVLRASSELGFNDSTNTLSGNGTFTITTTGSGSLQLFGFTSGVGAGGDITVRSGLGASGSPGGTAFLEGATGGGGNAAGGNVTILGGGTSDDGAGGDVAISAGASTGAGAGGDVTISGGVTSTGVGGSVFLNPGTGLTNGVVQIGSGRSLRFLNAAGTFSATFAQAAHTANRTLTLTAGTNLTYDLDSGLHSFADGIRTIDGTNTAVAIGSLSAAGETGWYFTGDSIIGSINTGIAFAVGAGNGVDVKVGSTGVYNWSASTAIAAADTGLARVSAGVIKSTDGASAIRGFLGGGAAVASATALPVPTGRVFHVTGTTTITSITSTNFASGAVITLIFDDVLTFTDGSNLVLAGNFVTTANDTITLVYDGTNWYETSRSVN